MQAKGAVQTQDTVHNNQRALPTPMCNGHTLQPQLSLTRASASVSVMA